MTHTRKKRKLRRMAKKPPRERNAVSVSRETKKLVDQMAAELRYTRTDVMEGAIKWFSQRERHIQIALLIPNPNNPKFEIAALEMLVEQLQARVKELGHNQRNPPVTPG